MLFSGTVPLSLVLCWCHCFSVVGAGYVCTGAVVLLLLALASCFLELVSSIVFLLLVPLLCLVPLLRSSFVVGGVVAQWSFFLLLLLWQCCF